ncbi:MAG TPA: four-helix bundle copper-binding protein [Aromatoleum sp.]|uniref:four-helix bundle copper-binding protein n=1 Tax=Aromatoleum sp. TaxID=2307007 RepID=UPI002B470EDE|nr:four-helix bundle copper-binding protein [Aromatoleum sp.]HJV24682.1 four-helix bundle copper-binding protein [Aromatoleum sp.]
MNSSGMVPAGTELAREMGLSEEMAECIDNCRSCELVCLGMATGHCLRKGGRHVEEDHLRTMIVCARTCALAAEVLTTGSSLHRQMCAVCADVCDACIASCEDLDEMELCIEACRRCKDSCEAMTDM